nr:hypothetical protein [uncultured Ralstonia sp.]
MKRAVTVLSLLMAGCALPGASPRFGDFADIPRAAAATLAIESVQTIAGIAPPASTTLQFADVQSSGLFGAGLRSALRQAGYGVLESGVPQVAPSATRFAYVLDTFSDPTQYRLTLYVGEHVLSRSFTLRQGVVMPLGEWTLSGAADVEA